MKSTVVQKKEKSKKVGLLPMKAGTSWFLHTGAKISLMGQLALAAAHLANG